MHGAEHDMHWMQRDFGLYMVNLFDTGQASRALELPKFSLAFLLDYCCGVQADKQFQLADWRIRCVCVFACRVCLCMGVTCALLNLGSSLRPLPQEMAAYARDDTHYLLYIYDRMRNELIRRGDESNHMLRGVLDKSQEVCLRLYKKPTFLENDYLKLYHKHKRSFNSQQVCKSQRVGSAGTC